MEDLFSSSKYRLEHAKRRLAEFEGEVAAFFDSDPYANVVEQNADGTQDLYKIKLVKPMPVILPGVASEVVYHLRSALDQAGFAVAKAAGRNGRKAHFPFRESTTEIEGAVRSHARGEGPSKDIPKEIFALMVSFQPYKGGNDLLWALNKLCNSQKHEIVTPMALHTGSLLIKEAIFSQVFSFGLPMWDRAEHEMTLARVPHGAPCRIDLQVETYIAIGDVDVIEGAPAGAVFDHMAAIAEGIIVAVEAEARRLGLIA